MDLEDRGCGLSRRDFLRTALTATAGLALSGVADAQDQPAAPKHALPPHDPRVVYRRLGRTGVAISHIAAAWDWNEWLYEEAVKAGVNYWHKIAGWPQLPECLGKLDREAWYCDVVVDSLEEEGAYAQFEWSRQHLGLAYVDEMKLHSLYETPEQVGTKTGVFKAFERLKAEGKVRHLAAAQHGGNTAAICTEMILSGHFDHLQPAVSVAAPPEMLAMLKLAQEHEVGIIGKKVMGAVGLAQRNPQVRAAVEKHLGPDGKWGAAVIKTVLAIPGVTAVTARCQSYEQFVDNLSPGGIAPTGEDQAAAEELRKFARAEVCSYCGACLAGCPRGLPISDILRFAAYHQAYELPTHARRLYAQLPATRQAAQCADCGACERACPQEMAVRRKLREAHALLA